MINFSKFRYQILFLIVGFFAAILISFFKSIPVHSSYYLFFSISFLSLLAISFVKPISEFFLLMNFFFFLGFWGKISVYILTEHRLGEAAGTFDLNILNKSLISSSTYALVLLIFQAGFKYSKFSIKPLWKFEEKINYPKYIIIFFLVLVFSVALINHKMGIFRVGIDSTYSLFLPISILFYWFMGPGSSFIAFSMAKKDYRFIDTLMIALTMTAISVSIISRNSLLYFSYPIAVKFFTEIKNFKKAFIHTAIVFIFFVISLFSITQLRRAYYYNDNSPEQVASAARSGESRIKWSYTIGSIAQVFMDRWIGIEGVIVANSNKSDEKFSTIINEDSKINRTSIYHNLSNSIYPTSGKYLFYTLPGPLGLLTFIESSSLKIVSWIVFLGILAVTYFVSEFFLAGLPKSAFCWWAASNMTQMSLFPIFNLKIYIIYTILIIFTAFAIKKISENYFQSKT